MANTLIYFEQDTEDSCLNDLSFILNKVGEYWTGKLTDNISKQQIDEDCDWNFDELKELLDWPTVRKMLAQNKQMLNVANGNDKENGNQNENEKENENDKHDDCNDNNQKNDEKNKTMTGHKHGREDDCMDQSLMRPLKRQKVNHQSKPLNFNENAVPKQTNEANNDGDSNSDQTTVIMEDENEKDNVNGNGNGDSSENNGDSGNHEDGDNNDMVGALNEDGTILPIIDTTDSTDLNVIVANDDTNDNAIGNNIVPLSQITHDVKQHADNDTQNEEVPNKANYSYEYQR